jgi:hypothetical protein
LSVKKLTLPFFSGFQLAASSKFSKKHPVAGSCNADPILQIGFQDNLGLDVMGFRIESLGVSNAHENEMFHPCRFGRINGLLTLFNLPCTDRPAARK